MDKTETITFRVTEKRKAEMLMRCLDMGVTMSDYIRYLIDKDLKEHENKTN